MEGAVLYKHSQAIHAAAKFSLFERKIMNCLLYFARNHQPKNENHQISVADLLKMMCIKTRNYTSIYLAIKNLAGSLIEWGILKSNSFKGNLTGVTLLELYNITDGLITFRVSKELNELLISPNQYAPIRMSSVMAMSSVYGVALYENCASYLGWGDTGWIDIATFRKLMGVGEIKYAEYRDLKSRVIKPAMLDINKNAEFNVELVEKKEAGSTARIKFVVISNNSKINSDLSKKELTFKALKEIGVSKSKANKWVKDHDINNIQKKIDFVNTAKNIKNKTGFLISAVEKDYIIKDNSKNVLMQLHDKCNIENEFFKLQSQMISDWFELLDGDKWIEICNHLLSMTENQPILFNELKTRLLNKSFLEYPNTKKDVLQITMQLIRSRCLAHLNPPKLPTWDEFLRKSP